jgi:hypothetical protein
MDVDLDQIRPHVTLTLFQTQQASQLVEDVLERLEALSGTLPTSPAPFEGGALVRFLPRRDVGGMNVSAARYRIKKPPAWLMTVAMGAATSDSEDEDLEELLDGSEDAPRPALLDVDHHLVVLVAMEGFLALYASHDTMRARLTDLLANGMTGSETREVRTPRTAELVGRDAIEAAFVRGDAKSAWLEGLHVPTILKADRKILSGPDLRFALDQFGDQTYTYTAAISELPAAGKARTKRGEPRGLRVGVSYAKNTLWTRSARNLGEFLEGLQELVRLLRGAPAEEPDASEYDRAGLPFVARPLSLAGLDGLSDGFDVGYEAPDLGEKELIAGEAEAAPPASKDPWRKHGRFVVDETRTRACATGGEVVADAYYDANQLARVRFRPIPRSDRHLEILYRVEHYHVDKADPDMVDLDRSLARRNTNFTLRYGSGHVIQNGALFQTRFRDTVFDHWNWLRLKPADDGVEYDLNREKPTKLSATLSRTGQKIEVFDPSAIGAQRSLFCFTKRHPQLVVSPPEVAFDDWWLLCDDGAGEIADFIAISPRNSAITFVHVKGFKKGDHKQISVTPFSEVISQAIKNLRAYEQGHLADMLSARTTPEKDRLVWRHDGVTVDRKAFIAKMTSLRRPLRHVVIFQPRTHETTWKTAVKQHRAGSDTGQVGRMRQLSALLVGAEATFQKLGATLAVVGRAPTGADGASKASSSSA